MRGHTLIELLLVLTLMGATATSLAPAARSYRDRASVVGAREAMVGLLNEARAAAVATGAARLRVASGPWAAAVIAADSTLRSVDFESEFGVTLTLTGGQLDVELAFDALGLGRMAGQTVRFRRGETEAELVVSSYGRVRRR